MVVIVADFMVNKKVVLENGVVDPSMFNVLFAMAWRGVLSVIQLCSELWVDGKWREGLRFLGTKSIEIKVQHDLTRCLPLRALSASANCNIQS